MTTEIHPCRISWLKYWHTFSAIFFFFFVNAPRQKNRTLVGSSSWVTHVNKRPNGNQTRVRWSRFKNVFWKEEETEGERLRQCRVQYSGLLPPWWRCSLEGLRQTLIATLITSPAGQQTGNINGLPPATNGRTRVRVWMRSLWIFQQHREYFPTLGSMPEAENRCYFNLILSCKKRCRPGLWVTRLVTEQKRHRGWLTWGVIIRLHHTSSRKTAVKFGSFI